MTPPSDWPEEHRSGIHKPPDLLNGGEMAISILTTRDLLREQLDYELESGALSAGAMRGLHRKIADIQLESRSKADDMRAIMLAHKELILRACDLFKNIPAEFIRKEGNDHRTTLAADDPVTFTNWIRDDLRALSLEKEGRPLASLLRRSDSKVEDTVYLTDVLCVVSAFLDMEERGGAH